MKKAMQQAGLKPNYTWCIATTSPSEFSSQVVQLHIHLEKRPRSIYKRSVHSGLQAHEVNSVDMLSYTHSKFILSVQ